MSTANQSATIERVHASGKQLLLAATGGGSGAISAPVGSARCVGQRHWGDRALRARSAGAWLGGPVIRPAASGRRGRWRCERSTWPAGFREPRRTLRGIGVTASLVSNRPKRGPHRVHVAWQSIDATVAISCELEKGRHADGRGADCDVLVLDAVAEACGVHAPPLTEPVVLAGAERREQRPDAGSSELLLGRRSFVDVPEQPATAPPPAVLFPGAFNPFHEGHRRMATVAAERCGAPVTFELSIVNVDKPPLDFVEIADRLGPLAGNRVRLTRAATFVEKARLRAGCVFVVGMDTLERIAEPRYYRNDVTERDAAIGAIAAAGCRFLVFGRQQGDRFSTLAESMLPGSLRAVLR